MNTITTALLVLAGVLLLAAVFVVGLYNKLVALRNRYQNAYAQIDVQLKRRYDLIPNLVETARTYLQHERGTLEAVITARNAASTASTAAAAQPGDPKAMQALVGAEGVLTGTLGRLFALSEAYPDLKANTTMLGLMEALSSTENKVAFSRQAYNDAVMAYNTQREIFPSNLVSSGFGLAPAELFVIEVLAEREPPKVAFT
jgi:LemA protein